MTKYYIEFLNADGKDREVIIEAVSRADAQKKFVIEFGTECEILDTCLAYNAEDTLVN